MTEMRKAATLRSWVFPLILLTSLQLVAQDDGIDKELDNLSAPSSPASNLVGIATSEIEHPTDLAGFMLSLRQATGDYSALPSNYAVDFAPAWLFPGDGKLTNATALLGKEKGFDGKALLQNFVISTAFTNLNGSNELESTKAGFGLKFPLVKPKATEETRNELMFIKKTLTKSAIRTAKAIGDTLKNDPEYQALQNRAGDPMLTDQQREETDASIKHRSEEFVIAVEYLYDQQQFLVAEDFEIEREGGFLDLAGGIALDFVERDFDQGRMSKQVLVDGRIDNEAMDISAFCVTKWRNQVWSAVVIV